MSEYQLIYTVIGALALVALFIGLVVFLVSNAKSVDIEIEKTSQDINAISAAHLVEECLKNKNDYISEVFLNQNKKKNICDLCGICTEFIKTTITDIDSGSEWIFDYTDSMGSVFGDKFRVWLGGKHHTHTIIIKIKTMFNEIHFGRLYVEV
jgi:hypothetical protein